jgi:hypothetical protein
LAEANVARDHATAQGEEGKGLSARIFAILAHRVHCSKEALWDDLQVPQEWFVTPVSHRGVDS